MSDPLAHAMRGDLAGLAGALWGSAELPAMHSIATAAEFALARGHIACARMLRAAALAAPTDDADDGQVRERAREWKKALRGVAEVAAKRRDVDGYERAVRFGAPPAAAEFLVGFYGRYVASIDADPIHHAPKERPQLADLGTPQEGAARRIAQMVAVDPASGCYSVAGLVLAGALGLDLREWALGRAGDAPLSAVVELAGAAAGAGWSLAVAETLVAARAYGGGHDRGGEDAELWEFGDGCDDDAECPDCGGGYCSECGGGCETSQCQECFSRGSDCNCDPEENGEYCSVISATDNWLTDILKALEPGDDAGRARPLSGRNEMRLLLRLCPAYALAERTDMAIEAARAVDAAFPGSHFLYQLLEDVEWPKDRTHHSYFRYDEKPAENAFGAARAEYLAAREWRAAQDSDAEDAARPVGALTKPARGNRRAAPSAD